MDLSLVSKILLVCIVVESLILVGLTIERMAFPKTVNSEYYCKLICCLFGESEKDKSTTLRHLITRLTVLSRPFPILDDSLFDSLIGNTSSYRILFGR